MITHSVAAGSFMVGRKKPEIIRALLGSCTGVTLFDREAGIGGLSHLLLPEPPSEDLTWDPEVNAVTGMTIFIDALCRLGARKERLQACIAGDALIDPVSLADDARLRRAHGGEGAVYSSERKNPDPADRSRRVFLVLHQSRSHNMGNNDQTLCDSRTEDHSR